MPKKRPVGERIGDFKEVYLPMAPEKLKTQASRCMDCGVPFCHGGCPLGNLIPDWNDLVYRNKWKTALFGTARNKQLPGVYRQTLPRTVRGSVRTEHQR